MSKRAENKSQRTAHIISVAERLFLERAIHEVQMQEIADACGIGIATLFRYFPKKELLVVQVAQKIILEMRDEMKIITEQPVTAYEMVEQILDYFIDFTTSSKVKLAHFHDSVDIYAKLSSELDVFSQDYIDSQTEFAKTLKTVVEIGINDGSIRPDIEIDLTMQAIFNNFSIYVIHSSVRNNLPRMRSQFSGTEEQQKLKEIFLQFIKPQK